MSNRAGSKIGVKSFTVVLQILSLMIGLNAAHALSSNDESTPALPLENLLSPDLSSRKQLYSNFQSTLESVNQEYIDYLNKCNSLEGADHGFIIRDTPFVKYEFPRFGLESITTALYNKKILNLIYATRVEKKTIYKRIDYIMKIDFVHNKELINSLINSVGIYKPPKVKPELLEIFELLYGGMTMTGSVDSFQFHNEYNPYTGMDRNVVKDGEVDVHAFRANFNGEEKELHLIVKYDEVIAKNKVIEKIEIRIVEGNRDNYVSLYQALKSENLLPEKYINPHINEERQVLARLREVSETTTKIEKTERKQIDQFLNSEDSLLIIPDLHNSPASMAFALNIIQDKRVQYVGTEISESGQADFNKLNKPNRRFALIGNLEEMDDNWNYKREWETNISNIDKSLHEIFNKASDMELIHAVTAIRSKPVIFLDAKMPYLDERSLCGTKLSHMTRNLIWAKKIPSRGRVVVFAGASHFAQKQAVNFQDFVKDKMPDKKIFILQY